ncbi:MAG: hypothetical protein ABI467_00275 [Kofleriaceae bacterium]
MAPPAPQEEDSGLHDIRSLAQSTKQRIKRTTGSNATVKDDDVLASSSASWKNLALPQPANMVSLPELDELPSKQELAKAAKVAAKQAARAARHDANAVTPASIYDSASNLPRPADASASGAVEFKPAFAAFAGPKATGKTSHKGRNLALVAMGLAAAAGLTLFVMTQHPDQPGPTVAQPAAAPAGAMAGNGEAPAKPEAAHPAQLAAEAAPAPAAVGQAAAAEVPADTVAVAPTVPVPARHATSHRGKGKVATTAAPEQKVETKPAKAAKAASAGGRTGAAAGEQDKDFDALLKEAGVQDKKPAKPKLDKTELSGDDFKKGMSTITAKAHACYQGTQGEANLKLVISPSGQVTRVTVTGKFAGKPEAACVSAAVRGASFPAWDGPPQSFGYPILLSE